MGFRVRALGQTPSVQSVPALGLLLSKEEYFFARQAIELFFGRGKLPRLCSTSCSAKIRLKS